MKKLLLCPFCGREVKRYAPDGREDYWYAQCENDKCLADMGPHDSEEELIKSWNIRVLEKKYLSQLRNLLAVIHRDGGHYTEKHGLEKSQQDAIEKIVQLFKE